MGFPRLSAALPRLRLLCPLLLAAGMTGGQAPMTELPTPAKPPDPQKLLDSLKPRLPSTWHLGEPSFYLGIPVVRVLIFDSWRGSPISAAINLCPGTENPIWQQTRVIRLVMRHLQHDWPPYDCRP